MEWIFDRLSELPPQIWRTLELAAREIDNPMRTATLGTANDLHASLRTVILRHVDPARRLLICHTDARSAKVRELRKNPQVQWLFYHPAERIQIVAGGQAMIHQNNAFARDAWQSTPLINRVNYCTRLAPGIEIPSADAAWPKWQEETPTVEESEIGWPNFAVIVAEIEHLELLQLRPEGHRRAGFTWTGRDFRGHWLVP